ncbi:MAG TPA: PDZ domain-containing protein [Tepidisphaeraceae bacterium]|jgi:hypothetical protein|nr:PDZ domain-containing protein [Tepidisphaeraceae bacterium]
MRVAFGLLGLLVTIGVIVLILHFAVLPYDKTVIEKGRDAQNQAEQMAGQKDGMRTTDSIKLEPQSNAAGKPVSLLVTSIVDGGPMESYFGLKRNDTITEINGMKVRDENDGELAVSLALEAYQRKQPLTVVRDGKTLTLPAPITPSAANPANPKPTGGLQGQLDAIQNAGGAR